MKVQIDVISGFTLGHGRVANVGATLTVPDDIDEGLATLMITKKMARFHIEPTVPEDTIEHAESEVETQDPTLTTTTPAVGRRKAK